ncbi:MaoC/PaaZ C-terminal domain-containing protein [Hydrogenophaga sp. BPS33]|uniref:MaoC/PaaZ C-terminal domain-containing protein n=1 Tax=Hydrogenophaga sp. BPS33 TaxID=2651974 RepID=UPI00131F6256|nr:MaoC/PaaZ C-terminal domain-containing protein [Hydrogenophaga sp. BPS33]QHE84187.1 3-alpha,7-alpha,12-alpha-trihydroxy-5-beta-cholest-24-enoyl-CoA hydratase [Hydrogenophaga sp. BPS33]
MPLDYQRLLAHEFPVVEQTYTERDCMLYALSVGFGRDPLAAADLPYVYERDLRVAPTLAVALGFRSIREAQLGIDYARVVHSEQRLTLHAPLPSAATVLCRTRVAEAVDKGEGRGAILYLERTLHDKATGTHLATSTMAAFCRGDGGFGGPVTQAPAPHALPERAPDRVVSIALPANIALYYRLSGDYNPLHIDPAVAARAGFQRPILHGLQVYGEVAREALLHDAGGDAARFVGIDCRFTGSLYPGDTIDVSFWQQGDALGFRVTPQGRDGVALDNGRIALKT